MCQVRDVKVIRVMMEQMQAGKTKRPRPRAKAWGDEGGGPKGTAPERHVPTLHQWPPPEPTLGPGRGAQLASPGQRALPAPCDTELWARSRLFGHGESGTRVDPSVPPFPARAVSPRGRLLGSGWRRRVAERPGRGLWVGGAGQGWAGRALGRGNPGGRGTPACPGATATQRSPPLKVWVTAGTPHPVDRRSA